MAFRLLLALLLAPAGALAGPEVCTTTLEAPSQAGRPPVEVSRCGAVQTTPELVDQRFFTYTAPFAEGVSVRGQLRDLFGIATGSINRGDRIRAFGFTDQTIIWDSTALHNTTGVLLEAQGDVLPWRTGDRPNGFNGSLAGPGSTRPAGR